MHLTELPSVLLCILPFFFAIPNVMFCNGQDPCTCPRGGGMEIFEGFCKLRNNGANSSTQLGAEMTQAKSAFANNLSLDENAVAIAVTIAVFAFIIVVLYLARM